MSDLLPMPPPSGDVIDIAPGIMGAGGADPTPGMGQSEGIEVDVVGSRPLEPFTPAADLPPLADADGATSRFEMRWMDRRGYLAPPPPPQRPANQPATMRGPTQEVRNQPDPAGFDAIRSPTEPRRGTLRLSPSGGPQQGPAAPAPAPEMIGPPAPQQPVGAQMLGMVANTWAAATQGFSEVALEDAEVVDDYEMRQRLMPAWNDEGPAADRLRAARERAREMGIEIAFRVRPDGSVEAVRATPEMQVPGGRVGRLADALGRVFGLGFVDPIGGAAALGARGAAPAMGVASAGGAGPAVMDGAASAARAVDGAGAAAVQATARGVEAMTDAGLARVALEPAGLRDVPGLRAFHGSPHDFIRFDLSKIGTGEGAQAYGWGLYFAEAEEVAKMYRETLALPPRIDYGGGNLLRMDDLSLSAEMTQALRALDRAGGDWDAASRLAPEMARPTLATWRREGYRFMPESARMYEVRINVDPNRLLDWDAPLSQQPQAVQRALMNLPGAHRFQPNWTGAQFYESAALMPGAMRDPKAASEALRAAGIQGIRYLDGGSRSAGDGTRNFVVFSDDAVEIVRKYGVGPFIITGLTAGAATGSNDE
jgi:hypothetical protein